MPFNIVYIYIYIALEVYGHSKIVEIWMFFVVSFKFIEKRIRHIYYKTYVLAIPVSRCRLRSTWVKSYGNATRLKIFVKFIRLNLRLGQMIGTKTQRLSDTCNSQSLNLEKLSEVALLV